MHPLRSPIKLTEANRMSFFGCIKKIFPWRWNDVIPIIQNTPPPPPTTYLNNRSATLWISHYNSFEMYGFKKRKTMSLVENLYRYLYKAQNMMTQLNFVIQPHSPTHAYTKTRKTHHKLKKNLVWMLINFYFFFIKFVELLNSWTLLFVSEKNIY